MTRISISATRCATVVLLALTVATFAAAQEAPNTLADQARSLVESIEQAWQEYDGLAARAATLTGDDQRAFQRQRSKAGMGLLGEIYELANNVIAQEKQGLDPGDARKRVETWMADIVPLAREYLEIAVADAAKLRADRDGVAPEALLDHEQEIARESEHVDRIAGALVRHAGKMDELGMDTASVRGWLTELLSDRAEFVAGRIEITREHAKELQARAKDSPDDAALKQDISANEVRLDSNVASLGAIVGAMKGMGLETTEYQQLLIQTTGSLSTDILEADVVIGLFQQWIRTGKDWIIDNAPQMFLKFVVFVVILLVFRILSNILRRLATRSLKSSKVQVSRLLEDMITSMVSRVTMLFGILVALSQVGVSLGPVLAGLGVAGFIIGFALQDTLSNFAAGMMILFYRPFDMGDMVEAGGVFGKVNRMTLVSTTFLTIDNQTLVVPNGKIWGDVIKNVTAQTVRRVDMTFGISYGDDIPHAEKVLTAILAEHPKVLEDPEPVIKLHNLGDSSVDFVVRPWVRTDDYWEVYWDVTREVKMRFDREDISIPFPQRDVHFYEEKKVAAEA